MTTAFDSHAILRLRAIIAANVRRERRANGLTQTALARKAGGNANQINYLEQKEPIPELNGATIGTIARVADALGVPPCTLLMTETERKAWCAALNNDRHKR